MSTLRLGFGAPSRLPSLDGFPDLLDGRWLNGRHLRPFDAAPALDRAEGGLLRRVEHLLMTSQCSEYGLFVVRGEPSRNGPGDTPGQPLHADDREAARSVGARVDLGGRRDSEKKLAEVEEVQAIVALMQPEDTRICCNTSTNLRCERSTRRAG